MSDAVATLKERCEAASAAGIAHREANENEEALACFDAALKILDEMRGIVDASLDFGFDMDRADLLMNCGVCLDDLDRLDEALEAFNNAWALLVQPGLAILIDCDPARAQLLMNRALCHDDRGELGEALADFDAAFALYGDPRMVENTELTAARALVLMNRANCLDDMDRFDEALEGFDAAFELLDDLPGHEAQKAKLHMFRGNSLGQAGRYNEARAEFCKALDLHDRDPLKSNPASVPERATLQMNLATCVEAIEGPEVAIRHYDAALRLHQTDGLAKMSELDDSRARLHVSRATCLQSLERFDEALEACAKGLLLHKKPALRDRPELDVDRASLHDIRAICLKRKDKLAAALQEHDEALALHDLEHMKRRPDLALDRAQFRANRGLCLAELGRSEEALSDYDFAIKTRAGQGRHLALPEQLELARTLANAAALLAWRSAPLGWALEQSERLIEIVDLAPPEKVEPWASIRRAFDRFHDNWLEFELENAKTTQDGGETMPAILLAVQGRRMVRTTLEAALSADNAMPRAVRVLARARARLRGLLDELPNARASAFDRGRAGRVRSRRQPEKPGSVANREQLDDRIRKARARVSRLSERAAREKGFGFLGAAQVGMTASRLREVLSPDEALVVGFVRKPRGEPRRGLVWILRHDGAPRLVDPGEKGVNLVELAAAFDRFGEGIGRGSRGPARAQPNLAPERKPDPMSKGEQAEFWPAFEEKMERAVWTPIAETGVVDGASKVVLVTIGELNNLPFAAGRAAAGLEGQGVYHGGSLAQFALGRGVFRRGTQDGGERAFVPGVMRPCNAVELLYDTGGADNPIPLTEMETRICARIWREATGRPAHFGGSYPWPNGEDVEIAHIACHGDIENAPDRTPQVALKLGPGGWVLETALENGPAARAWFITACTAARGYEDIYTGDPSGIASAVLRRRSDWFAAFLSPVPDRIGMVCGILAHLAMAEQHKTFEQAVDIVRKVVGGTGIDAETKPWRQRLNAVLADDLAPRLWGEYRRWRGIGGWPFSLHVQGGDKLQLPVSDVVLLPGRVLDAVERAAPVSETELRRVLARELAPLPDPNRRGDRAEIGIVRHGLTLFGDPRNRHAVS